MIIFDLDGTLANCEHRRHFVDPAKNPDYTPIFPHIMECNAFTKPKWVHKDDFNKIWKPDWQAFYEACDKDIIIEPTMRIFFKLWDSYETSIKIWSGRCQSVRDKTQQWLLNHGFPVGSFVKMRPIGNIDEPWDLKEQWYLDETIRENRTVDMVFDSDPSSIAMWRCRGIFVFDVNQSGEEF